MERIVVANRTGARVYRFTEIDGFELFKNYPNPLGRAKNRLMQTDRPGMGRGKFKGSAPHSMTGEKNPHEDAADQFATTVAKSLAADLTKEKGLSLKIVAEPKFLGKLKGHFNKAQLERISWVKKDLEKIPQKDWSDMIGLKKKAKVVRGNSRFPL